MSHAPRSARFLRSRPGRLLPVPLVLTGLAALLAGCGSGAEQQTETGTHTAGPVARVEVEADAGSVDLRRGPDGSSQVQRTLRWSGDEKPEYSQQTVGDTLRITARCPDGADRCRTDLVVTVPAAASSRVSVTTGDVTVAALTGRQELEATTGLVRGSGLGAAPVSARTTTGQVSLGFTAAPESVEAEATTGDVEVRVPVGPVYQVRAEVRNGLSDVEVADTPGAEHRITARSTTGNVSVTHG